MACEDVQVKKEKKMDLSCIDHKLLLTVIIIMSTTPTLYEWAGGREVFENLLICLQKGFA
jgi:hypothetical protein